MLNYVWRTMSELCKYQIFHNPLFFFGFLFFFNVLNIKMLHATCLVIVPGFTFKSNCWYWSLFGLRFFIFYLFFIVFESSDTVSKSLKKSTSGGWTKNWVSKASLEIWCNKMYEIHSVFRALSSVLLIKIDECFGK